MKLPSILLIFLILGMFFSCIGCTESPANTQTVEAELTETNQKTLLETCPPPNLTQSLERENLKARLEFLNQASKEMYIYLLSNDGKVVATFVSNGKVSSLNSYLTTNEQIVNDPYGYTGQVVESPDLDGSYGENPEGIFFFTTDGAYIEWTGRYIQSSTPMNIQSAVELTRKV